MSGLPDRRGLLVVSLPRNDGSLARAAREAGADALKTHVLVHHRASGTRFGSLQEERRGLEDVLATGLPTGLVPGEEELVPPEELGTLGALGFAFLDTYVDRLALYLYGAGIPVVPACRHDTPPDVLEGLAALPGEWLEAALVPPEGYGRPATLADLAGLAAVARRSRRRLIVPTQRAVRPEEVGWYFEVEGVWALMIGAVVTGLDERGVARATEVFRRALDRLFR